MNILMTNRGREKLCKALGILSVKSGGLKGSKFSIDFPPLENFLYGKIKLHIVVFSLFQKEIISPQSWKIGLRDCC